VSEQEQPQVSRTRAAVHRSRWPGWIWAIPIAAVIVIGWWAGRSLLQGGEDITISFDNVHGLKEKSSSVIYRGMKVGRVTELALAKGSGSIVASVHVDQSASKLLTSGTKFWLRGAKPDFSDPTSLAAIVSGPDIVMDPGPGKKAKHFVGLTHRPVLSGSTERPVLYELPLKGDVGGLSHGDPVKLRGFTVGEVETIGFRYDKSRGEIETPVTIALYPSLLRIGGAAPAAGGKSALVPAIDRLIRAGLRARLERDPPLIGSPQVTLEIMPGAPAAAPTGADGAPQIPAAEGGGLNSVIARVNKVPIDQIAQNVLDITHHVDALVSSPQLADAIAQLDQTLAQIHRAADAAGPKIGPLVESLRRAAGQLDDTAKAANKLLGGTPSQNDTQEAMREVTRAARSVRELADYLDRHPEAVVKGRSGQ
jgi:paraquat-inducible protein B